MFRGVRDCCITFNSVWIGNVPFTTQYNLFLPIIGEIEAQAEIQETSSHGSTEQKSNTRTSLEAQMNYMISAMKAYARASGVENILNDVDYTPSELKRATGNNIAVWAGDVHRVATTNLLPLTPYGISQPKLDTLDDTKEAFLLLLKAPENVIQDVKRATETIASLFTQGNTILNEQLDELINLFVPEHQDFVDAYRIAREISDPATITIALKGKVIDSATQKPIPGADIYFQEIDLHVKTNKNGTFQRKNLPNGPVHVVISYPGFLTKIVDVMIFPGQTFSFEETLDRM